MNYYSFTLTVPPEKLVYYSGKRRRYGALTQKQQWYFLSNLMIKAIWVSHFDFIDYVFEEHEDKRLHIHGYAKVNKMYQNFGAVERLVDNFYTLNQIIGIKQSVYTRLSNIQQTYKDISFWQEYISKHQNEIIFKSHYEKEREELKSFDNGVKIEINNKSQDDEGYYDTYRFTGEINKFFIEI